MALESNGTMIQIYFLQDKLTSTVQYQSVTISIYTIKVLEISRFNELTSVQSCLVWALYKLEVTIMKSFIL